MNGQQEHEETAVTPSRLLWEQIRTDYSKAVKQRVYNKSNRETFDLKLPIDWTLFPAVDNIILCLSDKYMAAVVTVFRRRYIFGRIIHRHTLVIKYDRWSLQLVNIINCAETWKVFLLEKGRETVIIDPKNIANSPIVWDLRTGKVRTLNRNGRVIALPIYSKWMM